MAISSSSSSSAVRTCVSIFVFLLSLGSMITMATASCASCAILHPQQKFCNADFVLKVRPKSWQYVGRDGTPVKTNNYAHDVQYRVKVESIFKGKAIINGQGTVLLHSPKSICNIDRLETGIRYLISGMMRGNKMEVTTCGIVEKWSDLTPSQRRGVRGFYETQCSNCGIFGSTIVRMASGNDLAEGEVSGLWSRKGCFFNPLASITYGSEDCETKYSFCVRQKDGECAWEGESRYDECFYARENKWQQVQFASIGLAAWRCPEDCKNLTPRKLKYKCKKATRKMAPCGVDTVRTASPGHQDRPVDVRTVEPQTGRQARRGVREVERVEAPEILETLMAITGDEQ